MSFTLLLLGLVSLAGAQTRVPLPVPAPPADGMVRIFSATWPDGMQEIWDIDRTRYDALPVWDPAGGPIPLTLSDALKAAEAWLTRQNPAVKTWLAITTALMREGNGRWLYRVNFAPEGTPASLLLPPVSPSTAGRLSLVVLLDGSVLEPKRIAGAPLTQSPLGQQTVQDPAGVYRAGAGVVRPEVLENPKPRYTAAAMRARIEGTVRLSCVVGTDGRCEDIKIVQSLDRDNGLDDEAVNNLRQWRFTPGTLDGRPVKVFVIVELDFNLRDKK